MASSVHILAYASLVFAACGNDTHDTTPDAPAQQPDAPVGNATCDGGNHFRHSGAMLMDSPDFGFITINGKVGGVMGAASPSTTPSIVSLTARHALSADLEQLGVHDVAVENFMEIVAPYDQTACDPGNTVCSGFYAQSGTFTVIQIHPRYQATFTLGDLYERRDSSGSNGAAMAGTITGCIDKENP